MAAAALAAVAPFVVVSGGSWLWVRGVGRLPDLVLDHVALWSVVVTVVVAAVAWRGFAVAGPRLHKVAGWWLVASVLARLGDGSVWDGPLVAVEHQVEPGRGLIADEQRQDGAGWGAHDGHAGLERRTTLPCTPAGMRAGQRAAVVVRRVSGTRMAWRGGRLLFVTADSGATEAVVDVFSPCVLHRGRQGVRFDACPDHPDPRGGQDAARIHLLRGVVVAPDVDLAADLPCPP